MSCDCPQPELCELLGRHIVGHYWRIWQGKGDPEKCEAYRRHWMDLAGIKTLPSHLGPSIIRSALNYSKAVARDVTSGRTRLSIGQYEERMAVCATCTLLLENNKCGDLRCGCNIEKKAHWLNEDCPQGKWPKILPNPQPTPRTVSGQITAKHVTRFAVGITTAPRPKHKTLDRCLASVIRAGFDPIIFAEPNSHIENVPKHVRIVQRPDTLTNTRFSRTCEGFPKGIFGAWRNWIQTLRDLLATNQSAQAIVILQDDIVFADHVREFLEVDLWPSVKSAFVSLYSPNLSGYERGPVGCHAVRGINLVGACALVFPRQVAQAICDHDMSQEWRGAASGRKANPSQKKAIDTYVGHLAQTLQLTPYYYNPSMCQHFSSSSSLGHGSANGKRRSGAFPGETVSVFEVYGKKPSWVRIDLPSEDQRFPPEPILSREPINIVIPAKDGLDLTLNCLQHIGDHGDAPLHIIYVDNGSERGVITEVKRRAEKLDISLSVVRNTRNLGFTEATNQGIALSEGRHVLLLNNDCFIGPQCLSTLKRHLEWHPMTAAVGPLTGDQGWQSLTRTHRREAARIVNLPPLDDAVAGAEACKRVYVSEEKMLSGFCCLKHRDALKAIGPLDNHPEYAGGLGTDDDWCHRARKAGWRLLLCHDAFAVHLHKQTFKRLGLDRRGLQKRAIAHYKSTR